MSQWSVTPDQISTLFNIGINALYWPNNINYCLILTQTEYHQVPSIVVCSWPIIKIHVVVYIQLVTHDLDGMYVLNSCTKYEGNPDGGGSM